MGDTAAILLDKKIALDYCQDITQTHYRATEVMNYCYQEGIRIDIRKECWQGFRTSISNLLSLYELLRKEASRILKEEKEGKAAEIYLETVITESNLERYVDLGGGKLPTIDELRRGVLDMGLQAFRSFSDDQIRAAKIGQSQLDLMVNDKFERGGGSIWQIEAPMNSLFDDEANIEKILDAYKWAKNSNECRVAVLVTREDSKIYSLRREVYEPVGDEFKIACPQDIAEEMT